MTIVNDIGPIARKIIAAGRKQQRQHVVDLQAVRGARDDMRRIIDEAIPSSDVGDEYPGFAAYVYVMNWALGVVETSQDMRELWRHVDRIAKADEDYMPEGPPWSPITRSMFNAWALCDLTVGVKRESLGSILLAIGGTVGMDPLFLSGARGTAARTSYAATRAGSASIRSARSPSCGCWAWPSTPSTRRSCDGRWPHAPDGGQGDAPRSSPRRHDPSRSNGPTTGPSSGSRASPIPRPRSMTFRSDLDDFNSDVISWRRGNRDQMGSGERLVVGALSGLTP